MALVSLKGVSKSFVVQSGILRKASGRVHALSDVSFEIQKGETVALVGGSGSGKSTVARILTGLCDADAGHLLWENEALFAAPVRERARRIQMIFQDPFASLNPKLSIETQLKEVLRQKGETSGLREHCVQWLETVGLPADALECYPFQFSGGQRQRIAIARALALEPRLLIADEPLSALDVTVQAQIIQLLLRLKADLGLTLLFITHDLAVVPSLADRMIVLENGRIVEQGSARTVLAAPQHPYTQRLLQAVPSLPC